MWVSLARMHSECSLFTITVSQQHCIFFSFIVTDISLCSLKKNPGHVGYDYKSLGLCRMSWCKSYLLKYFFTMPMTCITTLLHLWALFGGTQDKNNRLPVVDP